MATMTDEAMLELVATTKDYSIMTLRSGPKRHQPNVERIISKHGRRNLELRAEGKIAIVCTVTDDSDVCGICIFNTEPNETQLIMEGDPSVQAGVFLFEVRPCRGFPGDSLPA